MKRLLYYLGIIDLVWTIDHNGDYRLRIVWNFKGTPHVFGICGPPLFWDIKKNGARLLSDNTLQSYGNGYLRRWLSFRGGKPKKQRQWINPFKHGKGNV